jgi:hypothetical protein
MRAPEDETIGLTDEPLDELLGGREGISRLERVEDPLGEAGLVFPVRVDELDAEPPRVRLVDAEPMGADARMTFLKTTEAACRSLSHRAKTRQA